MDRFILDNEVFSLRPGEKIQGVLEQPTTGKWIAIMLRSINMPEGPRQPVRHSDGAPVEACAVLACHSVDGKWQWLQLSPPTKEAIGDHFFDNGAPKDQWLYLTIVD